MNWKQFFVGVVVFSSLLFDVLVVWVLVYLASHGPSWIVDGVPKGGNSLLWFTGVMLILGSNVFCINTINALSD